MEGMTTPSRAQFESAAKENMEKLYDSYLRDIL